MKRLGGVDTRQFAARLFALVVPFGIAFLARLVFPDDVAARFFVLLTDAVAVTAVAKIGVDVYVPSCRTSDGRVVLDRRYFIAFQAVSGLLLLVLILPEDTGAIRQAAGVSALVIQAALLAELARAKGNFFWFYLLKAPAVYVVAVIWAFLLGTGTMIAIPVSIMLLVLSIVLSLRLVRLGNDNVGSVYFLLGTILSIVVVVFSWKEPFFGRTIGDVDALEVLVFYTRYKMVVTFVFMLHNARMPNLLRDRTADIDGPELRQISQRTRTVSFAWALITTIVGLGYCYIMEPQHLLPVGIILASSFGLMQFGNLVPIYISFRKTGWLIFSHLAAIVAFVGMAFVLTTQMSPLLAVAIAGFASQIGLGLLLSIGLERRLGLSGVI
jgi:hypothetical protein